MFNLKSESVDLSSAVGLLLLTSLMVGLVLTFISGVRAGHLKTYNLNIPTSEVGIGEGPYRADFIGIVGEGNTVIDVRGGPYISDFREVIAERKTLIQ